MRTYAPRRLMRPLVAVAALVGLVGLAPSAAHAQASSGGLCKQAGCNNRDPVDYQCLGNVQTVRSYTVGNSTLQLMYSVDCDANWARVFTPVAEPFSVHNANGDVASFTSVAGQWSWTDMVNGHVHAWACSRMPATPTWGLTGLYVTDDPNDPEGETVYPDGCS